MYVEAATLLRVENSASAPPQPLSYISIEPRATLAALAGWKDMRSQEKLRQPWFEDYEFRNCQGVDGMGEDYYYIITHWSCFISEGGTTIQGGMRMLHKLV